MDFADLLQNVAFPIFTTIVLLNMLNNEKDQHKKETEGFIKAIDNNTAAIERIVDIVIDKESDREEIFKDE